MKKCKYSFVIMIISILLLLPYGSAFAADNIAWETKKSLPAPRAAAAVAVYDGKAYVFGGSSNGAQAYLGTKHKTTFMYDPKTDTWTQKADMPTARAALSAVVVKDKIYVIGGYYDSTPTRTNVVEIYDPKTDTWSKGENMLTPRSWTNALTIGDFIYVFSGSNYNNNVVKSIEYYDTKQDKWFKKKDAPFALSGTGMAEVSGKIYAFGGGNFSNLSNIIYEYDPVLDVWTNIGKMPVALSSFGVTVMEGKIYILGGNSNPSVNAPTQKIGIYDPISKSWSSFKDLTFPRAENMSAYINGKLYVIGGSVPSKGIIDTVEVVTVTEKIELKATGGDKLVTLDWQGNDYASGYTVRRSVTQGGPYETVATSVYGNSYKDTNVINGITYYYVVSALNNFNEVVTSNEASATPKGAVIPDPEPETGDRAILVVTLNTGLEKEFDLSMTEVNAFIDWYEAKSNGIGPAKFAIDKHNNNKGPFASRKDYVIFDKILTFEVSEYRTK